MHEPSQALKLTL
ncbi:binding--dependent transport system inner membrane component family protein, partial [Vibrio cholerae HC-42A1]